jgi:3,4-dihydroxy 2-butanone 4-phosphate synthase/GTP cyclohydrolase II
MRSLDHEGVVIRRLNKRNCDIAGRGLAPIRYEPIVSVRRAASARLPLPNSANFSVLAYESLTSEEEFVAVCLGDLHGWEGSVLVRIHSQCLTGDVFGSLRCDCGVQLQRALELIRAEGRGVIVYQFQEGRGIGIVNKIRAYSLQDEGADTVEANERLGLGIDLREYHQCGEILLDLGLSRVRVLTNNPLKVQALVEVGLESVERCPLLVEEAEPCARYLQTKRQKLGHLKS